MRFIDEAKIKVAAGHGGPGSVSFLRDAMSPRGGPDGGDGGKGGDVVFVASTQLGTLQDFRFKRTYKAPSGMHGSGANKSGSSGADIEIRVPVGTTIRNTLTGEVVCDMIEDGQHWIACKGGRGGKGNAHFTSSTHQAPRFAQPGEEGENMELTLELKLLADAAIIGFPNAGKSTLISRISAARPKIADYEFTTLTPNLGVVEMPEFKSFVIADIPGLIEGAHRGLGLGHKFLRHIERTRLFVHLLDGSRFLEDATGPDEKSFDAAIDNLIERYQIIRKELGLFNEKLVHKPEIVVINKLDLIESDPALVERARTALRQRITSIRGTHPLGKEPYVVSAASGSGLPELKFAIQEQIESYRTKAELEAMGTKLPDDEEFRT
ncbi:MAG: GTPase ObgE [Oligoflexia bacterium]|nr:GTPase ObgE [Oligoflexia bacterium]